MVQAKLRPLCCLGNNRWTSYGIIYHFIQFLAIMNMSLMVAWTYGFRTKYATWEYRALLFQWHPTTMIVGISFFVINGILTYRTFGNWKKKYLRLIHSISLVAAFVLILVGLTCVFLDRNLNDEIHMYSLHSWIGIVTVFMFFCQWIAGAAYFFSPSCYVSLKGMYFTLYFHKYFGMCTYIIGTAAALTGFYGKILIDVYGHTTLSYESMLLNIVSMNMLVLGCLVTYLLTDNRYQRRLSPESNEFLASSEKILWNTTTSKPYKISIASNKSEEL